MAEEVSAPVSELERAEIPWVVAYLREDIQDLRNEVREVRRSIQRLDEKFDSGLAKLDTKIDGGVERLDAKIDGGVERLDAKIDGGLAKLDTKIDARADGLDAKIDKLHREMAVQLRWIIGIVIGAMLAMTGVFAWIVDRILTP